MKHLEAPCIGSILIADPHPMYRRGLVQVLTQAAAGYLLHEAATSLEVLETVERITPTLVMMSTSLSELPTGTLALLATLRERHAEVAVVVVADPGTTPELDLLRLLRRNVNGLLLRTSSAEEVSETVRLVLQRGRYYNEYALNLLQNQLHHRDLAREASCFSERQLDVLHLIAEDCSNEEIAEHLCISVRTVEYHRSQMLQKTGTRTSLGLVLFAQRQGLLATATTPGAAHLPHPLSRLVRS